MVNLSLFILLFFSCTVRTKIETPSIQSRSIGTIDSRALVLYAYQKLLAQEFEESFRLFQRAHQAAPSQPEIVVLWMESLCEYPSEKQKESWTTLKNSLHDDYPTPSCLLDSP